jgi:hypothetical protein
VIELDATCRRLRPVLVDFVDRGEVGPVTSAALVHLDRCQRCRDALEATASTIAALRRLGAEVAREEPPAEAWPRLRTTLHVGRRRPAVMSPLVGLALSMAIVAVVVGPISPGGTIVVPTPEPASSVVVNRGDGRVIRMTGYGLVPEAITLESFAPRAPDGIPIEKEVTSKTLSSRLPVAI